MLSKLAVDSDRSLAPLARDREQLADFITQSGKVAKATADRRGDLEANFERLPRFLRELRPTMQRLGALSDEGSPLLADLNRVGPDFGRFIGALGPFSTSATASLTSLGDASVTGRTALLKSKPIIGDLKNFAGSSKGLSRDLRELTESLRDTGGIERLMDYVFYQVAAINGFDKFGHYLRAQLLVNLCSSYATEPDEACRANFLKPSTSASRAARSDAGRDPVLARTEAVLRGADADAIVAADKAAEGGGAKDASSAPRGKAAIGLPSQVLPGKAEATAPATAQGAAAQAGAQAGAGTTAAPNAGVSSLLDYLLGGSS